MLNGVPFPERHLAHVDPHQTAYDLDPADPEMPVVDQAFEQMSAYLDGELSAEEARGVEDWIAAEPRAKVLYSRLSSIQASLDQIQPIPTPDCEIDRMADRVIALAERPQPRIRRCPVVALTWQKIAATVVLMLGSGLSIWRWHPPQPMISLEDPPVTISGLPPSARMAERYLLEPAVSQDPYSILFVEADL